MFVPNGASGTVTATTTSQQVDISSADAETGVLRILATTGLAFIKFGDNTVVATSGDLKPANGFPEFFRIPAGATHFAVATASGSGAVNWSIGQDA